MERETKAGPGLCGGVLGAAVLGVVLAVCLVSVPARAVETAVSVELGVPCIVQSQTAGATRVGDTVIPMGNAVGIKLFSDGVLVVGLSPVETARGACCPGRDCGLKAGDLITHINGSEVDTIEEIQAVVKEQEGAAMTIQAVRDQHSVQLTAIAAENEQGDYQLGVWLRDSMAGIGTMTFYDPKTGVFGALGHGINDVDTAMLMPLESGAIMDASVSDVKKGVGGQPGELHGVFDLTRDKGVLYANTAQGVFGKMEERELEADRRPVAIAARDQVKKGKATILSNVREDKVEAFSVEITHISRESGGNRDMMIQVTDPKLLEATGGIVQGMSGSPILQDGKLVGAVTHVLVNDPTRGYGIFIENMLEAAG